MSKSEMVERVARALTRYVEGSYSTARHVEWRIHDTETDPVGEPWQSAGSKAVVASFASREERDAALVMMNVRNAIAAMREPTDAMLKSGGFLTADERGNDHPEHAEQIWGEMIDAALSD